MRIQTQIKKYMQYKNKKRYIDVNRINRAIVRARCFNDAMFHLKATLRSII